MVDIFQKATRVRSIAIHRKNMSTKPAKGDLSPKNMADQRRLRSSWTANMLKADFTPSWPSPLRHTRKADNPISTNRLIQTGPNSQLGGVKVGFLRAAYHVGTAGAVKIDPITPTSWQVTILITNLIMSAALMLLSLSISCDQIYPLPIPFGNPITWRACMICHQSMRERKDSQGGITA